MTTLKKHIVLFVEGDTDEVFFKGLLSYYRSASKTALNSYDVVNLKGVAHYNSKVVGKLKNQICPKAKGKGMKVEAVFCSYDTDVFEFAERPQVDWKKVEEGSTISLYCCCHFYCTLVADFTALLLPFFMYPFLPFSLYLSFPITVNCDK